MKRIGILPLFCLACVVAGLVGRATLASPPPRANEVPNPIGANPETSNASTPILPMQDQNSEMSGGFTPVVRIPVADSATKSIFAALFEPAGAGPFPAVILLVSLHQTSAVRFGGR